MPEKNSFLAIYIIQSVADEEAYATLDETTKNVVKTIKKSLKVKKQSDDIHVT
jgi:hypothetical protein